MTINAAVYPNAWWHYTAEAPSNFVVLVVKAGRWREREQFTFIWRDYGDRDKPSESALRSFDKLRPNSQNNMENSDATFLRYA